MSRKTSILSDHAFQVVYSVPDKRYWKWRNAVRSKVDSLRHSDRSSELEIPQHRNTHHSLTEKVQCLVVEGN